MMDKKSLKSISLILLTVNIVALFILNYVTVSFLGLTEGISFYDATEVSVVLWLLILVPVAMIAIPYVGDAVKKYENILYLALPIAGFVLHILLFFYAKGELNEIAYGAASISAGLGFYVILLDYFALIVVNIMALKGTDFGNEKLNEFVNKAADTATDTTEKVRKTMDKTVDNIKNKDE